MLQVPVEVVDAEAGTIRFTDADGTVVEQSALGGQAKLQWKVDWAMRWCALGVDYEMYGKDLTDSGVQSGRIVKLLGGRKPEGLIYELFLDANGEKISKSKGNGLTIEQWLEYGTQSSLGFYIFPNPKSAKQLHAGVIPRAVDDYWQFRERLAEQPLEKQLGNPVWHLSRANGGFDGAEAPGAGDSLPVGFGLLLNLASVLGAEATEANVAEYLDRFYGESARTPDVADLIRAAVNYTRDYIVPTLEKRAPTDGEAAALRALDAYLACAPADASAEELQTQVYEIGKDEAFGFESLRDWFRALYQTLLGSDQGPRMGSFIALYGIDNSRRLIAERSGTRRRLAVQPHLRVRYHLVMMYFLPASTGVPAWIVSSLQMPDGSALFHASSAPGCGAMARPALVKCVSPPSSTAFRNAIAVQLRCPPRLRSTFQYSSSG